MWTRREWLAVGAGSVLGRLTRAERASPARTGMGVVIHSYGIRRSADRERRFDDPLTFLDYCRGLGAGGVQMGLGVRDETYAAKLRSFLDEHKLYLEGSIALPHGRADVERFTAEVKTAKRCGATVFRAVLLNGRRYEVFKSAAAFRSFRERGRQALARARPVVEKHRLRMAIENHKDLQAAELLAVIEKQASPWIGICIDTGNNLALLETPQKTVEMLAPLAMTTHIKDMGVEEYVDGFLLAEVPLGTGFLDLATLIATLRRGRPDIRLNLEMITRDPLKIPCLRPEYWATLEDISGRRLAEIIALVRAKAAKKTLPRVSGLSKKEQVQREDDHVRQSLRHARKTLKL